MKKSILAIFIMAAALVGTMSCTKSNESISKDGSVLVVKLPDNVEFLSRAVESAVAGGAVTTTISNVEVFCINSGSGAVLKRVSFAPADITARYIRIEEVPAAVNQVLVVANIPSDVLTAVRGLTTYNAIKNYAFTVASQNAVAGINDKTLMGEGVPVTATDPNPDGHDYKAVSVALSAITARFEIGAVKAGTGITSVELVGVWINNFYADGSKAVVTTNASNSPFWVTSPDASTSPLTTPFPSPTVPPYGQPVYYNANSALVTLTASSQVYAYHVFAGANIPSLVMLVRGEYADGHYTDGRKYFLGFVTFNKYLEGATPITSILPNTIYKIGTGATGVEIKAEYITDKPMRVDFDLGVTVTLTPWTEKAVIPGV